MARVTFITLGPTGMIGKIGRPVGEGALCNPEAPTDPRPRRLLRLAVDRCDPPLLPRYPPRQLRHRRRRRRARLPRLPANPAAGSDLGSRGPRRAASSVGRIAASLRPG